MKPTSTSTRAKMNKALYPLVTMAAMVTASNAATVWIGNANGGDGVSFFQEANWDTDGNTASPYTTPAANSINPSTATTSATGVLSITGVTLTNIGAPIFGNGFGLDLHNATVGTFGTAGAEGVAGGATSTINLTGVSTFNAQFLNNDLTVNVGSGSTLQLRGTATPLNSSAFVYLAIGGTLTFTGGSPSTLNAGNIFNALTSTAYSTSGDISASFTFTGSQAAPTSITAITAIPEPSSAILLGLGTLGLISRRRRA